MHSGRGGHHSGDDGSTHQGPKRCKEGCKDSRAQLRVEICLQSIACERQIAQMGKACCLSARMSGEPDVFSSAHCALVPTPSEEVSALCVLLTEVVHEIERPPSRIQTSEKQTFVVRSASSHCACCLISQGRLGFAQRDNCLAGRFEYFGTGWDARIAPAERQQIQREHPVRTCRRLVQLERTISTQLAEVGKLVNGQVKIDESLDTFSAEQRFHGERLDQIERKLNQILDKVGCCIDDIRKSALPTTVAFEVNAKDSVTRWSGLSEADGALFGEEVNPKKLKWSGASTRSLMTEDAQDDEQSQSTQGRTVLGPDWPASVMQRNFGADGVRHSNLTTLTIVDKMANNNSSMVPQEGLNAVITSRFAHCVLEPSSRKRIAFDMVAMIFLLYDLCITPVAIAWDFPMSGWLLYCTATVAFFWTVDMVVTSRTGFYRAGVLVLSPKEILKKYARTTLFPDLLIVLIDWLTVFINVIFPEEEAAENPELVGAKLVRFSKVTRAIRILSVTRVIRIQEYLEHVGDRLHGGSSLMLGLELQGTCCATHC
eukprot:s3454_g3.t1